MLVADAEGTPRGAAYDPAADTWRRLPAMPIEQSRQSVRLWSGTELLAWGGVGQDGGAAYNPRTNAWRLLAEAPIAGSGARGVWTGTEMIVVTALGDAAAYEPGSDTWRVLSSPPLATDGIELLWTGSIVLASEWPGDAAERVTYATLDPTQRRWRDGGESPIGNYLSSPALWAADRAWFLSYEGNSVRSAPDVERGLLGNASFDPITETWVPVEGGCVSTQEAFWTGRLILDRPRAYDPATAECFDYPDAPTRPGGGTTRRDPSVVWTGRDLIVWSGGGGEELPSGPDGVAFRPDEP
jgi:hypothetical protein